MRSLLATATLSLCVLAAQVAKSAPPDQPERGRIARAALSESERQFDLAVQRRWATDPLVVLGNTRTYYVDGVGVMMSIELNLVTGPTVGPFNPNISQDNIARHKQKKLARLPDLRLLMRETLTKARAWFPELRDEDSIILGVSLLRYGWEDAGGIPSQIVMQTRKKAGAPVREQEF